jgi:hypothetical protein
VLKVLKVQKGLVGHKEPLDLKVLKDRVVTGLKVQQVPLVQRDRKELKVIQVLKEHRQMPDIKQTLNLLQMLDKTLLA